MGLDSVELIFDIEKHFDIEFEDQDLRKTATVGELFELIKKYFPEASETEREKTWKSLVQLFVEKTGLLPHEIKYNSHIAYNLGLD